jgi:hypothetical protein
MDRRSSESNDVEIYDDKPNKQTERTTPPRCRFQPRYLLYGLTILFSLFILIVTIGFIYFATGTIPQFSGTLALKGLTDQVTINREPNGQRTKNKLVSFRLTIYMIFFSMHLFI